MGRPTKEESEAKKNIVVLGKEAEAPEPETIETVTAEVVDDNVSEDAKKRIEALERELADKEGQIKVLGSLTKSKTRGAVKKTVKGSVGTIKIYDMKE